MTGYLHDLQRAFNGVCVIVRNARRAKYLTSARACSIVQSDFVQYNQIAAACCGSLIIEVRRGNSMDLEACRSMRARGENKMNDAYMLKVASLAGAALLVLGAVSTNASAQSSGYLTDQRGAVVKDAFGFCWGAGFLGPPFAASEG